ncbi:hypothetical protein V6N12_012615 [Hibiscus sabdariffa]|uniref:Uncharacterized protein n=1 Tax=Hibiscus sabdariffa TaxID=183260 RepID=A0ABR2DD39_9ROSI
MNKYNGKDIAVKNKINPKVSYVELQQEILSGCFEGDGLKERVILYVVGVFLCPTSDTGPSIENSKLLCSDGLNGKLKWCQFAYERLIDGISKYNGRESQTYLTGCIPMLEVRLYDYWSGVSSRATAAADHIGQIHAWRNKEVTKLISRMKGDQPAETTKESLKVGLEKQAKIEENLERLKEESKMVVDEVAGLSSNMMYFKKALSVIDAKFGIGLEVEKSVEEIRDGLHSKSKEGAESEGHIDDEVLGDDVVTLVKDENKGVVAKK